MGKGTSRKENLMMNLPLDTILSQLPHVRQSGRGWIALCPAHDDRSPSLSVGEADDGKILLHCFAGCQYLDILEALGLEKTQDFAPTTPRKPKFDWRRMSQDLEFASESHWLRAESIFKVARQCDVSAMINEDLDQAWRCLGIAFHSLRVSENLGIIAFQIRVKGLADEAQRNRERKAKAA